MAVLVITAVAAERDAIRSALTDVADVDVVVGGAGPASAAAGTSLALSRRRYELVLSAGIAGGFPPLQPGDIAVADAIVFADLGAETADGFVAVTELGFGTDTYPVPRGIADTVATRTGGVLGTVLTVATVTGSVASADALRRRFPSAVAEAMEGAGVAAAATAHGVPFGEIRAISNAVGPRDRAGWQIPRALSALGAALRAALDQPLVATILAQDRTTP